MLVSSQKKSCRLITRKIKAIMTAIESKLPPQCTHQVSVKLPDGAPAP